MILYPQINPLHYSFEYLYFPYEQAKRLIHSVKALKKIFERIFIF